MANSKQSIEKRVRYLEQMITDASLRDASLVPSEEDRIAIMQWGAELFRLSGGLNEVLFDRAGRVHIMVNTFSDETARLDYLSAGGTYFNAGAAASGLKIHPAFKVNGSIIRGFRTDKYLWPRVNNVNYCASLYNLPPAYDISLNTMTDMVNAANNATAYPDGILVHVQTRAEWSYFMLKSASEAFEPRGNSARGKSHKVSSDVGTPCGYVYEGMPIHTLGGSMSTFTRHDGTIFGISDLVGNVTDWLQGARVVEGEILIIPDNDAAANGLTNTDFNPADYASSKYKAIMPDGSLVAPGTTGTLKYDYLADPGTGGEHAFCVNNTLAHKQTTESPYGRVAFSSLTAAEGVNIPDIMRILGLYPLLKGSPEGSIFMRNIGTRALHAGGSWYNGSNDGLGCAYFYDVPSHTSLSLGGRSASLIQ